MRTVLVSYATAAFEPYQTINRITGRLFGFDECRCYGPALLDPAFVKRNSETLAAARGAGYWLWKPNIVSRSFAELDQGDILCYCDSGAHFVNPIDPLIETMERRSLDLLIMDEGFSDAQFTKRDAFVLMGCDSIEYARSAQRFASCFLVRKCRWSDRFVAAFLEYAQDSRILTDRPNEMGLPDYPEFIAHRHDQSIFSLLTKKYGVEFVGTEFFAEGLPERGSQIVNLTRNHLTPTAIVHRLLGQGVVRVDDLGRFQISDDAGTENEE